MPDAGRGRGREVRALVVDDEPLARELVGEILEPVGWLSVVGACGDGVTAVREIGCLDPDLVLLDVQMPEVDGFEVIERVGPEAMPEVIFVTAHESYSLRAFEVHALDYVLKPLDPDRLREAVTHARGRLARGRTDDLVGRLAGLLEERRGAAGGEDGGTPRTLTVRKGDAIRFVDVDEVDWLEAARNYVRVHAGEESYLVRSTLRSLARRLDPAGFVRIHRSAAVNLDRVAEVRPRPGGDYAVELTTGDRLRASRTYADRLLRQVH